MITDAPKDRAILHCDCNGFFASVETLLDPSLANVPMVVTGDPSQTDLPDGKKSGLAVAERILAGIDGIAIHRFTERDVVRHRLVQSIIRAYEKYGREGEDKPAPRQYTVKKNK